LSLASKNLFKITNFAIQDADLLEIDCANVAHKRLKRATAAAISARNTSRFVRFFLPA
jgi:hypothetical protein